MIYADPWLWLQPDGSLPPIPKLWPKIMQLARAIEAGWDLPSGTARQTLMLCPKRPERKPCPGMLWVARLPDDSLLVYCTTCRSEQLTIQNWQSTPWARPRPEPIPIMPGQAEAGDVDLEELVIALDEDPLEWQSYLDLETGRILGIPTESFRRLEGEPPSLFGDHELAEACFEDARLVHEDQSGRYALIEPMNGRESFLVMQDFVDSLSDDRMRRKLEQALRGSKPFRRFRDALESYPPEREHWFRFERQAMRQYALRWLEAARAEYELP